MDESTIHELKILPAYYADVWHGIKTFEVRKDDRGFQIGDTLHLQEYDPPKGYTGRFIIAKVCYKINDPAYCKDGYCILGIEVRRRWGAPS